MRRTDDDRAVLDAAGEHSLHLSEQFQNAILDSVPSQIAVLDEGGTIVAVNKPWIYTALEYAAEHGAAAPNTQVGANYLAVCRRSIDNASDDAAKALDGIQAVLDGHLLRFDLEYPCHSPDGQRWFSMTASPLRAAGGGAVITHTDVTERKMAEAALHALRAQMEELMKVHVASQTLAAIAHDLHQPLNAITTYSEAALRLLRAGNPSPAKLARAVEGSAAQAQRAARVVRELLDVLSKGRQDREAMDLNAAVRRALSVLENSSIGGFHVVLDLVPGLPLVTANRLQVEKVLVNLLQNGVEAMRDAGIGNSSITIAVRTAVNGRMAQVTLRDSGPGLDEQTLHRIFDPFFTTKCNGLGMGLTISRAMIEANGGRLWVETEPGQGASFHFTLPFAE